MHPKCILGEIADSSSVSRSRAAIEGETEEKAGSPRMTVILLLLGIQTFGTHGDNCIIDDKGTPYTTYASVETTVQNMAKADNFSEDCILNNKDKHTQACG